VTTVPTVAVPTEPHALAELRRRCAADQSLFTQLERQVGPIRASRIWENAEAIANCDVATETALDNLTKSLAIAQREIYVAASALTSLTAGEGWHVEYAETAAGQDIAAHLDDAGRLLRAAAAIHRQTTTQ
jgi:hypothetical protein